MLVCCTVVRASKSQLVKTLFYVSVGGLSNRLTQKATLLSICRKVFSRRIEPSPASFSDQVHLAQPQLIPRWARCSHLNAFIPRFAKNILLSATSIENKNKIFCFCYVSIIFLCDHDFSFILQLMLRTKLNCRLEWIRPGQGGASQECGSFQRQTLRIYRRGKLDIFVDYRLDLIKLLTVMDHDKIDCARLCYYQVIKSPE